MHKIINLSLNGEDSLLFVEHASLGSYRDSYFVFNQDTSSKVDVSSVADFESKIDEFLNDIDEEEVSSKKKEKMKKKFMDLLIKNKFEERLAGFCGYYDIKSWAIEYDNNIAVIFYDN